MVWDLGVVVKGGLCFGSIFELSRGGKMVGTMQIFMRRVL